MKKIASRSNNTKAIKLISVLVMIVVLLTAVVSYAWFRNTIEVPGINLQTGTFQYQFIGYHRDNASSELKTDFAYSTAVQEGDKFNSETGEGFNPILQDGALTAVTGHTNITNSIENPGEIYYVIRKLDKSVDLDVSISLDAELSKLKEFSGSADSLEAVGGFWYSIVDITKTAESLPVIKAAINDSSVFTVDGNTKQERTEEYFPNIRNEFLTTTLDDVNEYWCFKLSYGVKENADTSAYAGKTIALAVNLCVAQKGGLEGDESSMGQYYVRTLQQFKDALLAYKPNDSIIIQEDIIYEGDLIFNRPLKLQIVGSELTVKGNMRFNYASEGSFVLNTSLAGQLSVLKMDDVDAGGNLYLDIPDSSIEFIGQNSAKAGEADIYVEKTFSADVDYDVGMIITRARICDLNDNLKTIYLRNEITIDIYARTSVGKITVHNDNVSANRAIRIRIINKGAIDEISLRDMDYVAGGFDNPRILIDNYGEIAKPIELPTWSYKWSLDVPGSRDASNTRIIHQQGAGFMSVTNTNRDGFKSDGSGVAERDDIEYVRKETLVDKTPDANNITVHYMDNDIFVVRDDSGNITSDDTSLESIITHYLPSGQAEEEFRIEELGEIVSLKVICYGDYELTSEDYAFIRSMSGLVKIDLSDAVSAEVDDNGRTVPDDAFSGLFKLRYLTMSPQDNAWGKDIFKDTSVDDITLSPALTKLNPNSLTGIKYLHIGNHAQLLIDESIDYTNMHIFCADENTREQLIQHVESENNSSERFKEQISERPSTTNLAKISKIFLEAKRHGNYYLNLYDRTCFIVTYVGDKFDAEDEKTGYSIVDDFGNEVYYEFDFAELRIGNEIYQVAGYDDFAFYGKPLDTWVDNTIKFSDNLSSIGDYAFYGVSLPKNVDLGGCKTLGHGGIAVNENIDILTALKLESAGYYGFGKLTNARHINAPNLILHSGRLIADCDNIIRFDTGVLELADGEVDHSANGKDGYYLTGWTKGPYVQIVHTENANITPTNIAKYHGGNKNGYSYRPTYVLVSGKYAPYYTEGQGNKGSWIVDLGNQTAEDLKFLAADGLEFGAYIYLPIEDTSDYELLCYINREQVDYAGKDYTIPAYTDEKGNVYSTTKIREYAFYYASFVNVGTFSFADSYKEIGEHAFSVPANNSKQYDHLDLNNVTTIVERAFVNSTAVTIIGNNVTTIGTNAFNNANNLVTISMRNLGASGSAFNGCTNLKMAAVGPVTGSNIFVNCNSLEVVFVNVTGITNAPGTAYLVGSSVDVPFTVVSIGGEFSWEKSPNSPYKEGVENPYNYHVVEEGIDSVIFSDWEIEEFQANGKSHYLEFPLFMYVKQNDNAKELTLFKSFDFEHVYAESYALPDHLYSFAGEPHVTTILGNSIPRYTYKVTEEGVTTDTTMYVTRIEANSFKELLDVQNIDFPDKLEYIGESAFEGCSFGDVFIPGKGSLIIDNKAFYDATMASLTLSGTQSIGAQSFAKIKGPTNSAVINGVPVELGDVLTDIGESAFEGAYIEYIEATHNASDNVELNIGANAFKSIKGDASGEVAVDFGGAYVKLGEYAFSGVKLSNVTMPNMRLISSNAFNQAPISGTLDLSGSGNGVTPTIKTKAFYGTASAKMKIGTVILGAETKLSGNDEKDGAFTFCDIGTFDFNGAPAPVAYSICSCNLSNVYFREGITTIPMNAFNQCANLGNLYFGGVKTITKYAFSSATKTIGNIDFGAVTSIGPNTFSSATINGTVTIGNGVTIDDNAFSSTTIKGDITLGNNVSVKGEAFKNSKLKSNVTFGDNASLNGTAFYSFTIDGNLVFGENATLASQSVNAGTINGDVYLGDGLVLTARNFLRVNINGELSIGSYSKGSGYSSSSAFGNKDYRYSFKKLVFRDTCTSIAATTFAFMKINEVDFTNVKTLGSNAFAGTTITNIKNMDSITSIGANAFGTLESILPSTPQGIDLTNVTSIGDNAFEGNTLNDDLDFSNVETLGSGVFKNATINGDVTFGNRTNIPSGTFELSTINGLIDFDNITTIESNAFLNVKKLSQDLIFDNSINIEESAFSGAKLQNVTFIGSGVISSNAFANSTIGILKLGAVSSIAGATPSVAAEGETVSGDNTGAFFKANIAEIHIENAADPAPLSFAYATIGLLDYGSLTQTGLKTGADENGYSSPFYGVTKIDRINFGKLEVLGEYYFVGTEEKPVEIGIIDTVEKINDIRAYAFYWCEVKNAVTFSSLLEIREKAFNSTKIYYGLRFDSGITSSNASEAISLIYNSTIVDGYLYIKEIVGTKWYNNKYILDRSTVDGDFIIAQGVIRGAFQYSNFKGDFNIENVTAISSGGNGAFLYNTIKDKEIDLDSLLAVPRYAFYSCKFSAGTILYLDRVTTINAEAFSAATGFETVIAPVATSIGNKAFNGCSSMKNIFIPMVQTIGQAAFNNCGALKALTLPSIVSFTGGSSGTYSFVYGCSALEKIVLGENFASWGGTGALLSSVSSLSQVVIMSNPNNIQGTSFGLPSGAKLLVPLQYYDDYQALIANDSDGKLWGSVSLAKIDTVEKILIDGDITYIAMSVGEENDKKVELIGIADFGALSLTDRFAFPSELGGYTVVSIGNGAMEALRSKGIETVVLPSTLEYINFSGIHAPSTIIAYEISNNEIYKTVNGILYSEDGKTLVMYPAGLGGEVTLDANVTIIGENAFAGNNSITKVTINQSVIIADGAFAHCTDLSEINFTSAQVSVFIGRGIIENCDPSLVIKVPSAMLEAYKQFVFYDTDIVDRMTGE